MQDYRKLKVHARAHKQAVSIRKAVEAFPKRGFAEFRSQLTTAAESIPFNIVEGCGAESRPEFARFLQISIKSAFELESQLDLAKDYGILPEERWARLSKETVDIRKMTCGLRKRVLDSNRDRDLDDDTKEDEKEEND
jgi:four helix bundle protein